MDEYHEEKFRKALAETNTALANLLVVCENMRKMPVKKEFVVGKWYKPVATWREPDWLKCIALDDEMGWLTERNDKAPAYRYRIEHIDWSVAPKDEHP